MGNFCKYCGKPLVNGACDCAASQGQNVGNVQENASQAFVGNAQTFTGNTQNDAQTFTGNAQNMAQQGYVNQQQNFQYQQPQAGQAPYMQQQPSMQSQMAKQEAMEAKNLFVSTLKTPLAILDQIFATKKNTTALIVGAIHLLAFFLFTAINIPEIGEYMEFGDRAKVGLIMALIAGVPVAIMALVAMLMGKNNNPNITYVDSLAVFSAATVPGTILFAASFIVGLFFTAGAAILLVACYFAWLMVSTEAMNVVCKGNKDKNFWITLVVQMVIVVLMILIGKGMLEDAMNASFGSLFNMLY